MDSILSLPSLHARASVSERNHLHLPSTSSTAPPVTHANNDEGGRCTLAVCNVRHQNLDLSMTLSLLGGMPGANGSQDSQGNVTRYAAVMDFNTPLKTTGPCCCKSETDISDIDLTATNATHRASRNHTKGHIAHIYPLDTAKYGNKLRFSDAKTKLQERAGSLSPRDDRFVLAKGGARFQNHPNRCCKQSQGKLNRLDNKIASVSKAQANNKNSAPRRTNLTEKKVVILKPSKILAQDEVRLSGSETSSSNSSPELVDKLSNDSDYSGESDYSTDDDSSRSTTSLRDCQVYPSVDVERRQKEAHTETPDQKSSVRNDSNKVTDVSLEVKTESAEKPKSTAIYANTKPFISPSFCQMIAEQLSELPESSIPQSHSNMETGASVRQDKEVSASPSSPKCQEACKDLIRAFLQAFYTGKADNNSPDEIQETQQNDKVNNSEQRSKQLRAQLTGEENTLPSDTGAWERNGKDIQWKPQNKYSKLSYQSEDNIPTSGKPAGKSCAYQENDRDKISNKLNVDSDKKPILKECTGTAENKNSPPLVHQTDDKVRTALEKESRCGKRAKKTVIVRRRRINDTKQIQETARNDVTPKKNRNATLGRRASFDKPGNSINELQYQEHPRKKGRARSVAEQRKGHWLPCPISLNANPKPEKEVIEILKNRTLRDFSNKRGRIETKKDSYCRNSPRAKRKSSGDSELTVVLSNSQKKLVNVEDKSKFIKQSQFACDNSEKMISEKCNSGSRAQTLVEKSEPAAAFVESTLKNCAARPSPEQAIDVDNDEASSANVPQSANVPPSAIDPRSANVPPSANVLSDAESKAKSSDCAALEFGERTCSFIKTREQEESQGNPNVFVEFESVAITRNDVSTAESPLTSYPIKREHNRRKPHKEVQKNPKLVIGFTKLSPDSRTKELTNEPLKNSHTETAKSSVYDGACNKLKSSQLTTAKEEKDEHQKLIKYICDHNSSIASAKDSVALLESKVEVGNEDLNTDDVSRNKQSTTIVFSRVIKQTYVESARSYFPNDDKEQELETVQDVSSFNERNEISSVKYGQWSAEKSKAHHSKVTVLQGNDEIEDGSSLRSPGLSRRKTKQPFDDSKNAPLQTILLDSVHGTEKCNVREISKDAFDIKTHEMLQSGVKFAESNEQCVDDCDGSRVMLEAANSVFSKPKCYHQCQSGSAQKQLHFRDSHTSPKRLEYSITPEQSPSPGGMVYKAQQIEHVNGKENTERSEKHRIIRSSAFKLTSSSGRGGAISPGNALQKRTDCEVTESLSFKKIVEERRNYSNSPKFNSPKIGSACFDKTEQFEIFQENSPQKDKAKAQISTMKVKGYKHVFVSKSNDKIAGVLPSETNPQTTRQSRRDLPASAGQKATPVNKAQEKGENSCHERVNIHKQDRELKEITDRTVLDGKITSHAVCVSGTSEASKLLTVPSSKSDPNLYRFQQLDKHPAFIRGERPKLSLPSNNSEKLSCQVVNNKAAYIARKQVQGRIQKYNEMQGHLYNSCVRTFNHSVMQKGGIFGVKRVNAFREQTKDRIHNPYSDINNYQDAPLDLSMKSQTPASQRGAADYSILLGSLPGNNMSNSGTWHDSANSSHFPVQESPLNLSNKSNSVVGFNSIAESDINSSNYGTILDTLPNTTVDISSHIVEPSLGNLSQDNKTNLQIYCFTKYDESIVCPASDCEYDNAAKDSATLSEGSDTNHELINSKQKNETQSRFGKNFRESIQPRIEDDISSQAFKRGFFIPSDGTSSIVDRTFEPEKGPSCFSNDFQQEQMKASDSLINFCAICNATNPDIAKKCSGLKTACDSKYCCSKIIRSPEIQPGSGSCNHKRPVHTDQTSEHVRRKELKTFASGDCLPSTDLTFGDRRRQPTACKHGKQENRTRCLKSCAEQGKHRLQQTNSSKACSEHKDYKRSNHPVPIGEKKQLDVKQAEGRINLHSS